MNHFKELLISALIVALFFAIFDGQRQRKRLSEFDKTEKVLKAKFDSLTQLQRRADLEAIMALTDLEVAKRQLREQSHITEKFRNRYEVLRNTAVPRLSDAQIDSAVNRLYPIR
jgi:Mg2+/citrate symporter